MMDEGRWSLLDDGIDAIDGEGQGELGMREGLDAWACRDSLS